jgi:hypothetical protein
MLSYRYILCQYRFGLTCHYYVSNLLNGCCPGIVHPQSSGLGGGAIIMHRNGLDGTYLSYNGRERAPAAANATM